MLGIENLPLILVAAAVVMIIVVWVSFSEINTFLQFNQKKLFKEGISSLVQQIKLMKTGSFGTFSTQSLKAPENYNISFDLDKGIINPLTALNPLAIATPPLATPTSASVTLSQPVKPSPKTAAGNNIFAAFYVSNLPYFTESLVSYQRVFIFTETSPDLEKHAGKTYSVKFCKNFIYLFLSILFHNISY